MIDGRLVDAQTGTSIGTHARTDGDDEKIVVCYEHDLLLCISSPIGYCNWAETACALQ